MTEITELTAEEVDRELHRSHGWAARHALELGGYREGRRWHFPMLGIRAYQQRRAQQQADEVERWQPRSVA